jgi:hypothetical protein
VEWENVTFMRTTTFNQIEIIKYLFKIKYILPFNELISGVEHYAWKRPQIMTFCHSESADGCKPQFRVEKGEIPL